MCVCVIVCVCVCVCARMHVLSPTRTTHTHTHTHTAPHVAYLGCFLAVVAQISANPLSHKQLHCFPILLALN